MWSINRSRSSYNEDNSVKSLKYLRTVTLVSSVLGLLILVVSIIYFLDLPHIDDSGPISEFQNNWHICSSLGITIGICQILVSVSSIIFKGLESKTNIWCSVHALTVVTLTPVCILTASNYYNPENAALVNKKALIFMLTTGIDAVFCVISIITVPIIYGMEIQHVYTRLDCRGN